MWCIWEHIYWTNFCKFIPIIIQINNIKQLDRIIKKVIKIPGVENVERTGI